MTNIQEIKDFLKTKRQDIYPDNYEQGHSPRFVYGKELIKKYCNLNEDSSVIELGSGLPLYLIDHNGLVVCKDIRITKDVLYKNFLITYCNLSIDDLGNERYDLVTMSEIWEHLPCDLLGLKERVRKCMKPGSFLLCSFPRGSPKHKLKDVLGNFYTTNENTHFREFTDETINELMEGFELIEGKDTSCPAFGTIYVGLYKK